MSLEVRSHRVLYVILCDARSLIRRVSERKDDYISIFALKRTREHFEHIFRSKFDQINAEMLSYCPQEIIELFYRFHDNVEELKWYLIHTDDMPNAIGETITRDIHALEGVYEDLASRIESVIFEEVEAMPPVPGNE